MSALRYECPSCGAPTTVTNSRLSGVPRRRYYSCECGKTGSFVMVEWEKYVTPDHLELESVKQVSTPDYLECPPPSHHSNTSPTPDYLEWGDHEITNDCSHGIPLDTCAECKLLTE